MNHKDAETGVVYIYAANKKDDGNMQLDQWSEHFEQVYPQLLSNAGNKKAVDFLNLFRSKLVNPKERSRQKLDEEFYYCYQKIIDTFTEEDYINLTEQQRRKWIEDYFENER